MPSLNGAVVLVTGANGGIGTQFVAEALARGAAKVYATARTPRVWEDERVVPLTLNVNDPASIAAAVAAAQDVTVLVNNAGATPPSSSLLDISEADIRANMETNFFAPVNMVRAFAPVLTSRPESVIIDVHSVASWYAFSGAYSASKAALWSATNSFRLELAPKGVHVVGVHMGYVDTAMAANAAGPKMMPRDLVQAVYTAVEAGEYEVIADSVTAGVKAALSSPVEAQYPEITGAGSGSGSGSGSDA